MNEDDLRRILSATPDEPDLPADPVALVHRRARAIRVRRRGAAGALAVALIAVVAGTAVALPDGHRSGGNAQLHVATPSSRSPSATPATGDATTPAPAESPATSAPATQAGSPTAPAGLVAAPLAFGWHVHVYGGLVVVGGSFTGTDATVTAAQAANATVTGEQAGSGVFGWSGELAQADGTHPTAAQQPRGDDPPTGIYETNGGVDLHCDGPVERQARQLPDQVFAVDQPGTYQLVMTNYSCSGQRVDRMRFTVADVTTGVRGALTLSSTTVQVGQLVEIGAAVTSPGFVRGIDIVGQDGSVADVLRSPNAGCTPTTTASVTTHDAGQHTFTAPGRYLVLLRYDCFAFPLDTQTGTYPGTYAQGVALAAQHPERATAVVVTVTGPPPG